ncbi:MAG: putative zinc protease [Thermoleophilia bacterium]|nr:putative zinc protease [Thermoleophilia bacterium]
MQLSATSTAVTAVRPQPDPVQAAPHAQPKPLADAATNPGKIHVETLPNGVRMVVAERPGATATKFQVGIGAGSLQDPDGKLGLAHMLEHLSFEGSPTRTAPQQELLRSQFGNNWNAWTNQSEVVFWGIIPSKDAKRGAELITDMFTNAATTGKCVPQERAAVENEMVSSDGTLVGQTEDLAQRLLYGDGPATNNVIGTRQSVDAITSKDLQAFHHNYFVGRNTIALVDGAPSHLQLDTIRRELSKLPAGARVDNSSIKAQVTKGPALQVINQDTSGTVALDVLVPVPQSTLDQVGSPAAVKLLTSALSSRMNDRLRRSDHLTYGVGVKVEPGAGTTEDQSVLRVQTNVASKYAKQALEDIVSTLRDARDGFGPKTFEKDRTELRARLKTKDPVPEATTSELADETFTNALYGPGIEVVTPEDAKAPAPGVMQRALARLTPAQFNAAAAKVVSLDDIKVLAIGQLPDGGAQLLDALEAAGIKQGDVTRNPLDLQVYADQGIGVPKDVTPPLKRG